MAQDMQSSPSTQQHSRPAAAAAGFAHLRFLLPWYMRPGKLASVTAAGRVPRAPTMRRRLRSQLAVRCRPKRV